MRNSRFRRPTGRSVTAALISLLLLGCQGHSSELDLEPPRLLGVSLGVPHVPTDPIRVSFSEPVFAKSLDASTVAVLPFQLLGTCTVDLACGADRCFQGRCQRSPAGRSFLRDMARPPLSDARLAQTAPAALHLEEGELLWEPLEALAPERLHLVLVGPELFDAAGNRVAVEPDSQLALQKVFVTGPAETGRPLLSMLIPEDGAIEVPLNLRRVLVVFSRPVLGVENDSLFLLRPDGRRIAAAIEHQTPRCAARPLGTCVELRPLEPLPAHQRLQLRVSEVIRDLRGQPVLSGRPPAFATAASFDRQPPQANPLRVQVGDGCAVLRLGLDEPADLRARPLWHEQAWSFGLHRHELALPAPPSASVALLEAELEDLAGNRSPLPSQQVAAQGPGPLLTITEVLANPIGPEPAQELVEILNRGEVAVNLRGWTLDDGDDGVGLNELPEAVLGPGQLAVVVGPRFESSALPLPLPPEALLLRLPSPLGKAGLANSGESLVLRDPEGRLVSSFVGLPAPHDGRSLERIDPAGCDVAGNWRLEPGGSSTPGRLPR